MPERMASEAGSTEQRPVKLVGRFAPSPTGRMHAGNIFAALVQWLIVKSAGGSIVLRIEDLDRERSKPEFIDAVQRDFEMLGLRWDRGPYFQSSRDEAYEDAFQQLVALGLVYPCFCTRADLHAASAPHPGEKLVYPGTCRNLTPAQQREKAAKRHPAARLRVPDKTYRFCDLIQGDYAQSLERECGDFLIKRSDGAFAYQLAVVVDDLAQGVNCIARGVDLINSTPQQLYLQDLIGAASAGSDAERSPVQYAHVPLLVAKENRRLSKRDHDASIDELLKRYGTPAGVIGHIAYVTGMIDCDEPATPDELLESFDLDRLRGLWQGKIQILWRG